jgi:serine/threonine-protein kinase RsbW
VSPSTPASVEVAGWGYAASVSRQPDISTGRRVRAVLDGEARVVSVVKLISGTFVETTTVGFRAPARVDQLPMVRSLGETVLLHADFTLEEVADIRLALNEVATALILDAVPGSTIGCTFSYSADRVVVRVSSTAVSKAEAGPDQLSWYVVATLTESLSASQTAFDADIGGYPTEVEFS